MSDGIKRFIVRFRGAGTAGDLVARLNASPEVSVIEETPRMVLVQGPEDELRKIVGTSRDVVMVPEQFYEHPISPPRIEKK